MFHPKPGIIEAGDILDKEGIINLDKLINKIVCGDALEVLKAIPSDAIDLVITSPPYYRQRDYHEKALGNEKSLDEYIENLMRVFKECVRVVKNTGSIVFNLGDKYEKRSLLLVPYRFAIEALKREKVLLVNELTWVKLNPLPRQDPKKLVPSKEPFFIFAKSKDYYFNKDAFMDLPNDAGRKRASKTERKGERYFDLIETSGLSKEQKEMAREKLVETLDELKSGKITDFRMKIRGVHAPPYGGQKGGRKTQLEKQGFIIIKMRGNPMKRDIIESPVETIPGNPHPAIYPEYIIGELIKLLTKKGDIVLDPFMGSGTTAIASVKLDRKFIGIEINPQYCIYAGKRLSKIYQC